MKFENGEKGNFLGPWIHVEIPEKWLRRMCGCNAQWKRPRLRLKSGDSSSPVDNSRNDSS